MECPRSPVYRTSIEQKRHVQNLAKQKRSGAPNLREILRQNCRQRIIAARQQSLDHNRILDVSTMKEILNLELNQLEQDIILEEQVYEELLSELYGMQDADETAENNEDPTDMPLLCPMCQLKPLQHLPNAARYKCDCGVHFDHSANVLQLQQLLQDRIAEHELSCTEALRFFIEPFNQRQNLGAICGSCDFACTI